MQKGVPKDRNFTVKKHYHTTNKADHFELWCASTILPLQKLIKLAYNPISISAASSQTWILVNAGDCVAVFDVFLVQWLEAELLKPQEKKNIM